MAYESGIILRSVDCNSGTAVCAGTQSGRLTGLFADNESARLPPIFILIAVLAIIASCYSWIVFIATFRHPGAIGLNYNAAGSDYMVFHGAVQSYLTGHLATLFDGDKFTSFLNQKYGFWLSQSLPFRPWVYPPSYLLLILPFGFLNFVTSYYVFQLITAASLIAALTIGDEHRTRTVRIIAAAAISCPAAAVNVVDGQNAFLVVALLVAGIRLLEKHPLLAGAILGAVTIKPQFAFLLPVGLTAARQWRALLATAASASGLALLSAFVFGWNTWLIWLQQTAGSLVSPDPKWVEYGRMWGNSVWTCSVLMGAPPAFASLLQLGAIVLAGVAVYFVFRHSRNAYSCLTVLLAATLLAAPHWSPYDAVMLVVAAAFWVRQKRFAEIATWRWIVMLAAWLAPLVSPPLIVPSSRLLPVLLLGLIGLAMRDSLFQPRSPMEAPH